MESFPNEFLAHHLPLLFVAGISPAPAPPPASAADGQGETATPTPAAPSHDPYETLISSLRKALAPKRALPLWSTHRAQTPEFHVVLVDKNTRFPPRKSRPPPNAPPGAPLHSPLSPLSHTSPVYPDGLIAPIWIRKHRELIPSIFVLVLRLYEPPSLHRPLGNGPPVERSQKEQEAEQHADAEIVREIGERKRATTERGAKLVVVILTSRRMLDDPSLDPRLGALRRASGLDSRASLFVLSPVSPNEVVQFVHSLKSEIYESSLDFYRDHARRARRKRGRPSATATSSAYVAQQVGGSATPLNQAGWGIRADFKLATFAEFRQEIEVALKHYEDCWESLTAVFANTALLPPRTKRWAEAKVLTDCVNFKICKLHLYGNEPARAMAQLNRHIAKFRELCNGWGIGEDTFEFWSWLSKQYRLFGDLVDLACRSGFKLPTPPITPEALAGPLKHLAPTASAPRGHGGGVVTRSNLQHAGYYYFASAECAKERRDKFREAEMAEEQMRISAGESFQPSAALAHEKKINHAEVIIELYTKAYEIFRRFESNRMTLFLASRIAGVHQDMNDYEMSLRFYERIAKTYRQEQFAPVLRAILMASHEAALQAEAVESGVKCGFELLAQRNSPLPAGLRKRVCDSLRPLMEAASPTESAGSAIDVDLTGSAAPLICRSIFWQAKVDIGQVVPFQIVIESPADFEDCTLNFDSVICKFSTGALISVKRRESTSNEKVAVAEAGALFDSATADTMAPLTWRDGSILVIRGSIRVEQPAALAVEEFCFSTTTHGWNVAVRALPDQAPSPGALRWLRTVGDEPLFLSLGSLATVCVVKPRVVKARVALRHSSNALIDEHFPVEIDVVNEDDFDIAITLDVRLLSPEADLDDKIYWRQESSNFLLQSQPFGTIPRGSSAKQILLFKPVDSLGPRRLDLAIHCSTVSRDSADHIAATPLEIARTINIPVGHAFACEFETTYLRRTQLYPPLLEFTPPTAWDGANIVTGTSVLRPHGQFKLRLQKLAVLCEGVTDRVRVLHVSGSPDSVSPIDLHAGDVFALSYQLEVSAQIRMRPDAQTSPLLEVTWTRLPVADGVPSSRTLIPLGPIHPPPAPPVVICNAPLQAALNRPSRLTYTIHNPSASTLDLNLQVESSEHWLFSGPRKIDRILLLPEASRQFSLRAIPVAIGEIDLPCVRVFSRVRETGPVNEEAEELDEQGQPMPLPQPLLKEVDVIREYVTHEPSFGIEKTRGPMAANLRMLVLPT